MHGPTKQDNESHPHKRVRSMNILSDDQGWGDLSINGITKDRGQYHDISGQKPGLKNQLQDSLNMWKAKMIDEFNKNSRPFPVGHREFKYTQLPARDGVAHGNIKRSNRFPNCSFFTNWIDTGDKITWNIEVLSEGDYKAELYYTCPHTDLGSTIELSFGSNHVTGKILQAHDPPLHGIGNDRVKRMESYVKAFNPMNLGTIHLEKGTEKLTLKALNIPGNQAMDFRLLMLNA